jgi:predicted CopG family antitoxin
VANAQGEREIWIDEEALNKLDAMRGPGENYSDVILKLAVRERRS